MSQNQCVPDRNDKIAVAKSATATPVRLDLWLIWSRNPSIRRYRTCQRRPPRCPSPTSKSPLPSRPICPSRQSHLSSAPCCPCRSNRPYRRCPNCSSRNRRSCLSRPSRTTERTQHQRNQAEAQRRTQTPNCGEWLKSNFACRFLSGKRCRPSRDGLPWDPRANGRQMGRFRFRDGRAFPLSGANASKCYCRAHAAAFGQIQNTRR